MEILDFHTCDLYICSLMFSEIVFKTLKNNIHANLQIGAMRSNASGSDQKLVQLQDEIEELSVWKDKVIEYYK